LRLLIINGPNLNMLGQRDPAIYGSMSLHDIEEAVQRRAQELGTDVSFFQSNSEGSIIDYLQAQAPTANGIVINPGALTHYGLSLREALVDTALPVVEVHLSNIYAREEWRHRSVVAPVAVGQISGLSWRGYVAALEFLTARINEGATG
jgi:3-dehydroquinate dehydratase-2